MVHIGNKIKTILKEKGLSVSEFARRINTSRENVYGIFKRQTLDTGQLLKINDVLEHDFFQYYGSKEIINAVNEESAVYKTAISKTKLFQVIKTLRQESETARNALDMARQEIEYLKKINLLLEEKAGK